MPDATDSERVRRYQKLAHAADKEASKSRGETQLGYLRLAEQWRRLADLVEEVSRGNRPETGVHERHQAPS